MIEILLERVKRKDRRAQQEFYHRFSVDLFRLAYRYVTNEQDAGSIVNTGFFKIFNHMEEFTYKGPESMQAWMKKVIINEALMFLRQRILYQEAVEGREEDLLNDSFSDDRLILEDYYILIRKLPADLRTVFNLYAIDGFSHKEIAGQLNIKEASSRVYLTRARRMLQNYLTRDYIHNGRR
jgi:RNA polymerase sigma-70 factor, ECF subfamily